MEIVYTIPLLLNDFRKLYGDKMFGCRVIDKIEILPFHGFHPFEKPESAWHKRNH